MSTKYLNEEHIRDYLNLTANAFYSIYDLENTIPKELFKDMIKEYKRISDKVKGNKLTFDQTLNNFNKVIAYISTLKIFKKHFKKYFTDRELRDFWTKKIKGKNIEELIKVYSDLSKNKTLNKQTKQSSKASSTSSKSSLGSKSSISNSSSTKSNKRKKRVKK